MIQTPALSAHSWIVGPGPGCLMPFSSTRAISQYPLPLFPFPLAHGVFQTAGGSPKGAVTRSSPSLFFSFFDLHHLVNVLACHTVEVASQKYFTPFLRKSNAMFAHQKGALATAAKCSYSVLLQKSHTSSGLAQCCAAWCSNCTVITCTGPLACLRCDHFSWV